MADNHGNTPAAWTSVGVAMLGFLVGGIALMLSPVNLMLFYVGLGMGLIALPLFIVMSKLGFHADGSEHDEDQHDEQSHERSR
ncbi:HGxxPAAW family protein [uncultured Nocardioides sp.]|uniref:HGxxPAAW family protein n=1 Tax=uncultured Nocardioides sp. TaxID=198441 RepID=UPI0025E04E3A|nr:HGxxPAAW family protein [uncultured Nocardioides sp.]